MILYLLIEESKITQFVLVRVGVKILVSAGGGSIVPYHSARVVWKCLGVWYWWASFFGHALFAPKDRTGMKP